MEKHAQLFRKYNSVFIYLFISLSVSQTYMARIRLTYTHKGGYASAAAAAAAYIYIALRNIIALKSCHWYDLYSVLYIYKYVTIVFSASIFVICRAHYICIYSVAAAAVAAQRERGSICDTSCCNHEYWFSVVKFCTFGPHLSAAAVFVCFLCSSILFSAFKQQSLPLLAFSSSRLICCDI